MPNKKEKRQAEIFRIVLNHGRIKVKELAAQISVTPETIRTDLTEMEKQKKIIREHGYARPLSTLEEIPYQMREQKHMKDKRRVAMRALREIRENQTVYLDAGSTIILGLPALPRNKNITIVTNGLPLAYEAGLLGHSIIFCSGMVSNIGLRTYGLLCSEIIQQLEIDIAIFGCDGLMDATGFTTLAFNEVGIKQLILRQSKINIVVTDRSKFESRASYNFGRFADFDVLVTNPLTSKEKNMVKGVKKIIEV